MYTIPHADLRIPHLTVFCFGVALLAMMSMSASVIITAKQEEDYLAFGGTCCPSCCSTKFDSGQVEITEAGAGIAYCSCRDCRLEWIEQWKLIGLNRSATKSHGG